MCSGLAMPFICITAQHNGTTNGINMPNVPQLVPVVKAVIADNINTVAGTICGAIESAKIDTK